MTDSIDVDDADVVGEVGVSFEQEAPAIAVIARHTSGKKMFAVLLYM